MKPSYEIAIVGSGFAGSLLARILARLGYDVVLLERGKHPRFAIGESSTPLANLSLERLGLRYGLEDCYSLATHGRWLATYPHLRRGLKRGFTFYRHHPAHAFENRGLDSERLLVAASADDSIADSHWFRADIDHHFVHEAIAAGVEYHDKVELKTADFSSNGAELTGSLAGENFAVRASFVVDATGPVGFLARQLAIPSALHATLTRSALVYGHFDNVRLMADVVPDLPAGPYPDDWAAVHHLIDEGWMYSLRFDNGTTSAGFLLTPQGTVSLNADRQDTTALWQQLLARYPTIGELFAKAAPTMPMAFRPSIQHRLTRAAGERWVLMPHTYAFVDALFSTGIAWALRAVERLGLMFEEVAGNGRIPRNAALERYQSMLRGEADQIDLVVAGAYRAMPSFDLFCSLAMFYFAAVSFAEASQRVQPDDQAAWRGFLGVGDPALEHVPREALQRLTHALSIRDRREAGSARDDFNQWMRSAIESRNVAGLADPGRRNLYPLDFDALIRAHDLLGMTRQEVIAMLPALRGSPNAASPMEPLKQAVPHSLIA